MTAALELKPTDRVLEVGTGSGYHAAILAELASRVVTVERVFALAQAARSTLGALGYEGRVDVRQAGADLGCPEDAPFDAIVVAAGAPKLPTVLLDQLAPGGGSWSRWAHGRSRTSSTWRGMKTPSASGAWAPAASFHWWAGRRGSAGGGRGRLGRTIAASGATGRVRPAPPAREAQGASGMLYS